MFIDIHAHAYWQPQPVFGGQCLFSTPEEVLARYDELEVEKGVLLPNVSPEFYIPQSVEDILAIAEKYPDRFIPFCNVDPRALTNSAEAPLGDLLRYYKDLGCKGIGEVMPNLPFLDPLVQNLFKHVEDVGFPLIFDISDRIGGRYGLYDDPGLVQLEESLRRFPRLVILGHGPAFWAEITRIESSTDRGEYPNYPIKEEGVVPKLLRRYENLYADLSAYSGANALMRDPDYAVKFINEFQDKLLFGIDLCRPDQPVPQVDFLRSLCETGQISEETFHKVARKNAVNLLGL